MLTQPQQEWPTDPDEKILMPVCLDSGQFVYLMAALEAALQNFIQYEPQFLGVRNQFLEALAFLNVPEDAACFPLCEVAARLAGLPNFGEQLLINIDTRCGTDYYYLNFCSEINQALIESAGEPEAFYVNVVNRWLSACQPAPGIPVPEPFPDLCAQLVAQFGDVATQQEIAAFFATCGITVFPGYDWEKEYNFAPSTQGSITWQPSPYPNIPDNRTRYLWTLALGLQTTFGTPGGTGGTTQRHYLYAKIIIPQRTVTHIQFTYNSGIPVTGAPIVQFQTWDAGTDAKVYPTITLINDGNDYTVSLPVQTDRCDLIAFAVLGGTASGNNSVVIKQLLIRGLGEPF